jgi:Flp pilus assembly protein TadG
MRLTQPAARRRSGAALVEAAFVLPVLILLLYGIFCGALMVLAVDEVDTAAREGARWASVRGSSYQFNTLQPAATADDIKTFVKDQPVTLDKSLMTVNVSWQGSNRPGQYVTIEVRYQWPGMGPFPAREFVAQSSTVISY